MAKLDLITIIGPTASGKTSLAARLAYELDTEIISADSRQVYKRMTIGTGKDLTDYFVKGKNIPFHLIDIAEPGEKYNVFKYQQDFIPAYSSIKEKGKLPILCGGSGLYLESILQGYRMTPVPENTALRKILENKSLEELTCILKQHKTLHNTTDIDTCKRAIRAIEIQTYYKEHPKAEREFPKLSSLTIGLNPDRELRRKLISKRLRERLDNGMIEEVKSLLGEGISAEDLIYYGLEYKYVTLYVIGKLSFDEMFRLLEIAIHQFAKRQMTWFRGMERRGIKINWLDGNLDIEEKVAKVKEMYESDHSSFFIPA